MVEVAGGILLAFAVIAAIIIILHFWLETLLKALGWTIIAALASVVFWAVVALIVVLIDSAQQDLMGTVVGVVLSLPIVAAVAWIVWEEFFPSGHSPASNRRSKP
jgi:hypothetical protein